MRIIIKYRNSIYFENINTYIQINNLWQILSIHKNIDTSRLNQTKDAYSNRV